jgi:hypothetical protein
MAIRASAGENGAGERGVGEMKTDASAYAYFVWQKGYQGKTILDWVVAVPKKAEKQVYQPSLFELEAI